MRNRAAFVLFTATFTTFLAGCIEAVDSTDVTTDSLFASVELVSHDGVATDVSVRLSVGGSMGTDVQLKNGDHILASAQGQTIELAHDVELFGGHRYVGVLPRGAENVAFSIDYLRGDMSAQAQNCGRSNAIGTFATMPKPFELSPMMSQARLATPVTVAWSNAGTGNVELRVSGSCIQGGLVSVRDAGVAVLDRAVFAASDSANPTACNVHVTARRCASGQASPSFGEGGSVRACQDRSLSFRVVP